MKFLVFGAGVLGCNLANNLFRAGKDVTLLARGPWADEIRRNGLRIKNTLSRRTAVSPIPVAAELLPGDDYDVIFVAVRYTQIETILETLRASLAKTMIFVGNNVAPRKRQRFCWRRTCCLPLPAPPDTEKAIIWPR